MPYFILISLVAITLNNFALADSQTLTLAKTLTTIERAFDGKVEAVHSATVSGQTSAHVAEINFDVGDRVDQGETIIRLVSEDQQGALQQALASLAAVQAALELDKKELERLSSLFDKGIVSRADLDRAQGKVKAQVAQLDAAQGAVRRAKQQMNYTTVQAPFSGLVSERHIEIGEAVSPGTPLMSGFDPNHLRVILDVPQDVYESLADQPVVTIRFKDTTINPEKITFYPVANPQTGSVKVRLDLPGNIENLRPGQWVKALFKTGEESIILIPQSAVINRSQVNNVYVKTSNGIQLRNVRLGKRKGALVAVTAGLNVGDVIITNPQADLISTGGAL